MAKSKRQKRKDEQVADRKQRRKLRIEAKLCVDCGQFPALPDETLCLAHKARRAATAAKNYHAKRLKRAGLKPHEYALRAQLTGGLCENCHKHPITHFDFDHGTDNLRFLLCIGCWQGINGFPGGLLDHLSAVGMVASFYNGVPMTTILLETHFEGPMRELLERLRRERINAPTILQPATV